MQNVIDISKMLKIRKGRQGLPAVPVEGAAGGNAEGYLGLQRRSAEPRRRREEVLRGDVRMIVRKGESHQD